MNILENTPEEDKDTSLEDFIEALESYVDPALEALVSTRRTTRCGLEVAMSREAAEERVLSRPGELELISEEEALAEDAQVLAGRDQAFLHELAVHFGSPTLFPGSPAVKIIEYVTKLEENINIQQELFEEVEAD